MSSGFYTRPDKSADIGLISEIETERLLINSTCILSEKNFQRKGLIIMPGSDADLRLSFLHMQKADFLSSHAKSRFSSELCGSL